MTVPFLHAGYTCSFVRVTSCTFCLLGAPKTRLFVFVIVHCAVSLPFVVIGESRFHFAALVLQQNGFELQLWCQDCLNHKKGLNLSKYIKYIICIQPSILFNVFAMTSLEYQRLPHVLVLCGENLSLSLLRIGPRKQEISQLNCFISLITIII